MFIKFHFYLLSGVGVLLEVLAVDLDLSLVHWVESEFLEDSAANEETGGVGGGIVGQTAGDSVAGKLVGVGGRNDNISDQTCVGDLGDDVLKTHMKSFCFQESFIRDQKLHVNFSIPS